MSSEFFTCVKIGFYDADYSNEKCKKNLYHYETPWLQIINLMQLTLQRLLSRIPISNICDPSRKLIKMIPCEKDAQLESIEKVECGIRFRNHI